MTNLEVGKYYYYDSGLDKYYIKILSIEENINLLFLFYELEQGGLIYVGEKELYRKDSAFTKRSIEVTTKEIVKDIFKQ